MHDQRRVHFEGPANFRDLGGYRSSFGGMVRWRSVYRSDGLHHLTPADIDAFHALGIASVFDLRSDGERTEHPDPVQARLHAMELTSGGVVSGWDGWLSASSPEEGVALLRSHYLGYLTGGAPTVGRLLTALADDDHRPAVIHCMAGKDRTGVAVALLLSALGVARADVVDDYALSATYRTIEVEAPFVAFLEEQGLGDVAIRTLLSSPAALIESALDHIDEEHGDVEAYLHGPAGVAPGTLDSLRATLLVDDD